jgi:hypothetical protein
MLRLKREDTMPREQLVTREMLEQLVDSLPANKEYAPYLKGRWIGMVMWWHQQSVGAKWKYFLLRGLIIGGGVSLPVATTVSAYFGWHSHIAFLVAVTGAVVAACTAWEGVKNYGETWREKRRAAELLKVQGWLFLQRCGKYAASAKQVKEGTDAGDVAEHKLGKHAAFGLFVTEVEAMIAREVGEYLELFAPSLEQSRQAAANIEQAIGAIVAARLKDA